MKRRNCFVISALMLSFLVACGKTTTNNPSTYNDISNDIKGSIQEMTGETVDLLECEVKLETKIDGTEEENGYKLEESEDDSGNDASELVSEQLETLLIEEYTELERILEQTEASPNVLEMSDDLYDFTFMLDNVVYKLPFPLVKLKENGWEYDEEDYPDDYEMPPNSNCFIHKVRKDGMAIDITVINMSDNTKKLIDCNVGGIDVRSNEFNTVDAFSIAKDIDLNSSEEEIVSAYGKANTINQDTNFSDFVYSQSPYVFYRFILKESGSDFSVNNWVSTESDKNILDNISDDLYDFTFLLDNVEYRLPFPLTKLQENGWEYDKEDYPDDEKVPANSEYTIYDVSKNGISFNAYVINMSGNTKKLIDCKVGGISVSQNSLKDAGAFSIAKGISVDSTEMEIVSAYGEADDVLRDDNFVELSYKISPYINYYFLLHKNGNNSIRMMNYVVDESDQADVLEEVPEYLETYRAPAELGNDINSFNVKIDGDLYRLPAPVSAFTDNGWIVIERPSYVPSGNSDDITLERNGKKFHTNILNFADYLTIPENCAVYEMRLSIKDAMDLSIELPNGINMMCNKKQLSQLLPDTFSEISGGAFDYRDYKKGTDIQFLFDSETEELDGVILSIEEWPYE